MSDNKEVRKPIYYLAEEFNLYWEDNPHTPVAEIFRIFVLENDLTDLEKDQLIVYLKLQGSV